MDLLEKTATNIEQFELLPKGSRVLIAVSGGVDSMVLLHVLHRLGASREWRIEVLHFNHCLRGAASDFDQEFVREAASRLELRFHLGSGDVAEHARASGVSLEMAGRELRHRFFAETAERLGCSLVALAQHADDQVETVWMRLLRGEVGAGFAGMRWKSGSFASKKVRLVRPFLNVRKAELLDYAKCSGVQFREDASNSELKFLRNRLRHEVLPTLERIQPQLNDLTLRTAEVLLAEKDFLACAAKGWRASREPPFDNLHVALQREVLRQELIAAGERPNFELIEELRRHRHSITVRAGHTLNRGANGEIEAGVVQPIEFRASALRISLAEPGETSFGGLRFHWKLVQQRGPTAEGVEYFDAQQLGTDIILRHWQPGDRFQPIGGVMAKLQDIFTNLKVSPPARRDRVLATAASGEIFWVEGLRIGENFKVKESTTGILEWSWRNQSNQLHSAYAIHQTSTDLDRKRMRPAREGLSGERE